ncbi:MAG: hypothetical protein PHU95_01935 [Candidatus Thermoplasmatota archaeon]|nr:hypothetical protein [Candidatus Thermoplasmatota archaeon]MDD5778191.1 hypothetical protein [Candidatus Thermoplasmatota archaeon]
MVTMYRDFHATNHAEEHYHIVESHQWEIFKEIAQKCRNELTEYDLVRVAQGYKIVDSHHRAKVFFNCYRSSAGYRIKIIPHDPEFFKKVFTPIVESIEKPEGVDFDFNWNGFILAIPEKCTVCGEEIEAGEPILCIQNPYETDVWKIIKEEWDVDVMDFRACLKCANAEGLESMIRNSNMLNPYTIPAYDWLKKKLNR